MVLELQSHTDIMRAAQVSRRWRDAALGCEEFFIDISLNFSIVRSPITPSLEINRCANRIANSAPTPIQLRIQTKTVLDGSRPHPETLREIRELLVRDLPRIIDLSLQACDTIIGSALSALAHHQSLRLRRLELAPSEYAMPSLQLPGDMLHGCMPKLHTLCLYSFNLPTGRAAALAAVRHIELYRTETNVSDAICGDFPHLRYLHLEQVIPVIGPPIHTGQIAVASLQTLVVFSELDDQLREIDFSRSITLVVVGAEDAAVFLACGPTVRRLELHIPYGEPHPLLKDNMSDAVAHLTITTSSASSGGAPHTHRTITFGLAQHLEIHGLDDLDPFRSIAQDLALIDMNHFNVCEFLSFEADFPKLQTVLCNFQAELQQELFPLDTDVGLCPALQLLKLYSTTTITEAGSRSIQSDMVITMCTEMGFFESESDQPKLLIQGLEINHDEDSDEERIDITDIFKNLIIEVRLFALS